MLVCIPDNVLAWSWAVSLKMDGNIMSQRCSMDLAWVSMWPSQRHQFLHSQELLVYLCHMGLDIDVHQEEPTVLAYICASLH